MFYCNYYLRNDNEEEINKIIAYANNFSNDKKAIINYFSLEEDSTTAEISKALIKNGFYVSYSKKFKRGDIGIGQLDLIIKRGNWNDS